MPLRIIRPVANGTHVDWGASGPSPGVVDTGDPVTHDDDASYAFKGGGAGTKVESYVMGFAPTEASSLTWVRQGIRAYDTAGEDWSLYGLSVIGGVDSADLGHFGTVPASYTTSGPSDIPRTGGTPWVAADMRNTFEFGFRIALNSGGSGEIRVTSMWGEINYEIAGGFGHLVAGLGPVIGLATIPLELVRLEIWKRTLTWVRRDEMRKLARAIREYQRRIYLEV